MTVLALAIGSLAALGVFLVPFLFPPSHPSLSASYTAGFNNRVAALAAAFVGLLSFALAWKFQLFPNRAHDPDRRSIPLWLATSCLAVTAAFNAAFGLLLCRAEVASVDNRYFLEYMDDVFRYHERIYADFSFAYGPLLLYFPLWIHALLRPFHIGIEGAYYVALMLAHVIGLVVAWVTLENLPISRKVKAITLCLFAILSMCPVMGLSYTLVRFLAPFSTLVFISRIKNPLFVVLAFGLGEALQLAVSPELGFAFAAGACFYAICMTAENGLARILAIAALPVGAGLFLWIGGPHYLDSLRLYSHGDLNLIVEPLGYIILFLIATVWLVPRMLAGAFRQRRPEAVLLASLFIICLGLLPPAFGRSDPLHVFFNGAGMFLLASVAIGGYSGNIRKLWFLCFACSLVWMQFVNFMLRPDVRRAVGFAPKETQRNWIDTSQLESIIGDAKISVPFWVPLRVEDELKQGGHFLPDRESFNLVVTNPDAEKARAARMDRVQWALIPAKDVLYRETPSNTSRMLGIGYQFYPKRRQPYVYGAILLDELQRHWTPVATVGDWIVYHQNAPMAQTLHPERTQ